MSRCCLRRRQLQLTRVPISPLLPLHRSSDPCGLSAGGRWWHTPIVRHIIYGIHSANIGYAASRFGLLPRGTDRRSRGGRPCVFGGDADVRGGGAAGGCGPLNSRLRHHHQLSQHAGSAAFALALHLPRCPTLQRAQQVSSAMCLRDTRDGQVRAGFNGVVLATEPTAHLGKLLIQVPPAAMSDTNLAYIHPYALAAPCQVLALCISLCAIYTMPGAGRLFSSDLAYLPTHALQ
eukprot:1586784-Rhodomonas_salina.2